MPPLTTGRSLTSVSRRRSWDLALLTPADVGRRNRRAVDGTFLILASVATGCAAVAARSAQSIDSDLAAALGVLLRWAPNFWRATFVVTLGYATQIVGIVLFRQRWLLVRDVSLAVLLVVVVGSILGRIVDHDWNDSEPRTGGRCWVASLD